MRLVLAAGAALALLAGAGTWAQPPGGGDMQGWRQACAADAAKLCPDAKTREDRHACMTQNQDKLSDTCKAAVAAMRARMQSMHPPGGQP
jgi:hypothetical protein